MSLPSLHSMLWSTLGFTFDLITTCKLISQNKEITSSLYAIKIYLKFEYIDWDNLWFMAAYLQNDHDLKILKFINVF